MKEKLSEYAHNQWSGWMNYLFSKCEINEKGEATIPKWAVDRWKNQIQTPYDKLSEEEKNSDRIEADGMIKIMESFN